MSLEMCIIVVDGITSSDEAGEGKPTVSSDRKATVLDTTRRVYRTPPGSEGGACAHGGNAGTWESVRLLAIGRLLAVGQKKGY